MGKRNASLNQRTKDPKKPFGPPYANLQSKPKETSPYEPVDFDASKSHDANNMPCKSFVWDFGDDTPKQKTNQPYIQHKYEKPGTKIKIFQFQTEFLSIFHSLKLKILHMN